MKIYSRFLATFLGEECFHGEVDGEFFSDRFTDCLSFTNTDDDTNVYSIAVTGNNKCADVEAMVVCTAQDGVG